MLGIHWLLLCSPAAVLTSVEAVCGKAGLSARQLPCEGSAADGRFFQEDMLLPGQEASESWLRAVFLHSTQLTRGSDLLNLRCLCLLYCLCPLSPSNSGYGVSDIDLCRGVLA